MLTRFNRDSPTCRHRQLLDASRYHAGMRARQNDRFFGHYGVLYCGCTSRMITTSESLWPRTNASCLPSNDQ